MGSRSVGRAGSLMIDFTHLQGQYLAFIHLYTKLNRQAPAEADISGTSA
jgi:hypothetical protein